MASTSVPRSNAGYGKITTAAATIYSDNQSLVSEIRKAMHMMKEIAVDLEKDNKSEMVKELEDGVVQLEKDLSEFYCFSSAVQSIGNDYQPGNELTDFSKLLDDKMKGLKGNLASSQHEHRWLRQFREAIWNVHHEGQPMPGEEQEDIVMTSTQSTLLNTTCPLTGKPVTELAEPVRSMDCKHIYEKKAVMQHMKSKVARISCPVAGCPKLLIANRVLCDVLLPMEIDEMRSANQQRANTDAVEDFTRTGGEN